MLMKLRPGLIAWLMHRRWQEADAEEFADFAIARGWEHRKQYDREWSLFTWVWNIAWHHATNELRKNYPGQLPDDPDGNIAGPVPDDWVGMRVKLVRPALGRRSPRAQEIIRRHFYERQTYEEIAADLHMPATAVRKVASRAYAAVGREVSEQERFFTGCRGSAGRSGQHGGRLPRPDEDDGSAATGGRPRQGR